MHHRPAVRRPERGLDFAFWPPRAYESAGYAVAYTREKRMHDENALSDPLETAAAWREAGLDVALATVVKTWGSAPRQPGSQMCINERGEFVGSVSGGCVEAAVIEEATALLKSADTKLLSFGVTNEQAWEVGLACGGQVEVFVERVE